MVCGNTKRVVVIRDIHSNIIEEAILVLKCKPGDGGNANASGKGTDGIACSKPVSGNQDGKNDIPDYILKEAELVISSYIKENKQQLENCEKPEKKPAFNTKKRIRGALINIVLAGSTALLVFLVTRLL